MVAWSLLAVSSEVVSYKCACAVDPSSLHPETTVSSRWIFQELCRHQHHSSLRQNNRRITRCDEKLLVDSLCQRVIVTPDGNITKPLDPDSAALTRDTLAKTVYSRLFDWLVDKINNSIGQDPDAKHIIGVLDIYGFESFKINSFEQLCINLTNEK